MEILVVDDHPIYVDGLSSFLKELPHDPVITNLTNPEAALDLLDSRQFDLALIDFHLESINGIQLMKAILVRHPNTNVVIISGEENASLAKQAIDCGAAGFIPKSLSTPLLKDALNTLLAGNEYLSSSMREKVDQLNRMELAQQQNDQDLSKRLGLTPRQIEVLKILLDGHSNKRISQILNISPDTVKEHLRNIYILLDVDSRLTCATRARELGLDKL